MRLQDLAADTSPHRIGGMHPHFHFTVSPFRPAFFIIGVVFILSAACAGPGDYAADCEIDRGPCWKRVNNKQVELDITPKPVKTMEVLHFIVYVEGGEFDQLGLDLSMPGMRMGQNQVALTKTDDGRYAGKGIIPRCPSGRRLWQATVELPGAGTARFRFNVTY